MIKNNLVIPEERTVQPLEVLMVQVPLMLTENVLE